jgi:hypothetical protein
MPTVWIVDSTGIVEKWYEDEKWRTKTEDE